MTTYYILDKEGKIIGELKTDNDRVTHYFAHGFAHIFDVPVGNFITQQAYDQKHGIYRCSICRTNTVDAENGFDTCDSCLGKV